MTRPVTLALDAMGGDHGPSIVIPGAALTLERRPDAKFVIFGDQAIVEPLLDAHPKLKAATVFHHTDVSVKMDELSGKRRFRPLATRHAILFRRQGGAPLRIRPDELLHSSRLPRGFG